MRTLVFLAVLFGFTNTTWASGIETCVSIENELDRLACYDRVAGRTVETVSLPETGKLQVEVQKSAFEDTTDVYLFIDSEEAISCGFGGAQEIRLFLRCVENTTALIIATHCHVTSGHGGYGQVDYRIDDKPSGSRSFNESTNNRSLGLWNGRSSIPMIKSLFGADKLLVRFTPFNENPKTATFSVTGIEDAIKPLRESCNW